MMNILEKNVNNVERFYGFTAFHIGQSPKKKKRISSSCCLGTQI